MTAHRKLDVAVQMDPIARINIHGDSTFALLLEAQARGHRLSYYTPDRMALRDGEVFATVAPLEVRDVEGSHFTLGEEKRIALAGFDVTRFIALSSGNGLRTPNIVMTSPARAPAALTVTPART